MEPEISRKPRGNAALQLWYAWPGDLSDAGAEAACAALLNDAEARACRPVPLRPPPPRIPGLACSGAQRAIARPSLAATCLELLRQRIRQADAHSGVRPALQSVEQRGTRRLPRRSPQRQTGTEAEAGPEVGVDVEAFSRAEEIVPLAPKVFSLAEQEQLNALPAAERPHRALSLWTLKEAYIKARGMGLSLPLRGISFLFGERAGNPSRSRRGRRRRPRPLAFLPP